MSINHKVRFIDHTGDIGIQLEAGSPEEIFQLSAQTMFEIICPSAKAQPLRQHRIDMKEDDLEQLWVSWLSHLNVLFQTEQFLLAAIDSIKIENNSLQAVVKGDSVDPAKHRVELEIKAVTFHKMYIRNEKGRWRAQVIFDV
jgi:SHS2 domain-containing protein